MLPLQSVIATGELALRPRRSPDYQAENRALVSLARHLATSPESVLERLVAGALELCGAHSAGLSLIEEENGRLIFRWPVIAGPFAANVFGTTPRDFSPCGIVVDTNATQLFVRPGRHYAYFDEVDPPIVEALLHPFFVDGRPRGTIWVISHDETRKFDAEDARVLLSLATFAANAYQVLSSLGASREADRRKDDFLAQLSHEMRSPLQTAMIGLRTLTLEDSVSSAVKARAAPAIERSLKSLSRMVEDILDVSKIREGKLSIEIQDADLAKIVREAVDACKEAAREAQVDLDVDIAPALPAQVDATRIHQVVGNLLSNAIKFTPPGGTVSVEARAGTGYAEIEVRDSGEGIHGDLLPRIFEKFVQGDVSITRRHGGLGIGLAVARHVVELHDGSIEALSDGEGKGSTFRVRLPSPRPRGSEAAPAPLEPVDPVDVRPPRRLPVGEDQPGSAGR